MNGATGKAGKQMALVKMLQSQLNFCDSNDAKVEESISRIRDPGMAGDLRAAKKTAVEEQQAILGDLVLKLEPFLVDIILNQNKMDQIFTPLFSQASNARGRHFPDLNRYEGAYQCASLNIPTFPQLVFNASIQFQQFSKAIMGVDSEMKRRGIRVLNASGVIMKAMPRAFYKVFYVYNQDASQLTDFLRACFVFDNFDDLYRGLKVFEEMWVPHGGILRVKDRFVARTAPFGYRDCLVNVYAPSSERRIACEVQFHHSSMYNEKHGSHLIYRKARLFNRDDGNLAWLFAEEFIRPSVGNMAIPNPVQPALFAQQPSPYAQQPSPYAQQPLPYAQQPLPYAQQPSPYAQQPPSSYAQHPSSPYGQQAVPYTEMAVVQPVTMQTPPDFIGEYQFELDDNCGDCDAYCKVDCCPGQALAEIQEKVAPGTPLPCCGGAYSASETHKSVREAYGIPEEEYGCCPADANIMIRDLRQVRAVPIPRQVLGL